MKFEEYYEETREQVDARLKDVLFETEGDATMRSMLHYGIEGGKRFRPTLCVLTSDALGGDRKKALNNACLIELVHAASLMHDDLVDDDTLRRGMPTFWKAVSKIPFIGPPELDPRNLTVLMGDNMWSLALLLVDTPEMLKAVVTSIRALAEGAIKESRTLLRTKFFGSDVDDYIEVISLKTGSMYALSTHLGAMATDTDHKTEEMARQLGMNLGICYQLADDISEHDVPKNIDAKGLMLQYANEYDNILTEYPDSEYKEMLKEVITYMINEIIKEEGGKDRFQRTEDGFAWVMVKR